MAYETGALSGTDDLERLIELLKNFAQADGWTIDAYAGGLTLQLHKGYCFANLAGKKTYTVNDSTGSTSNASSPDYRIEGRLGVDTTPVSPTGNERVSSNDFKGPYATYWLFSGDGVDDPDYIHMVVQKSNGRFCHFGFGNVDKKGVTYAGGAFMIGYFWAWWFNRSTYPGFGQSGEGSDITSSSHCIPFENDDSPVAYNIFLGDLVGSQKVIAGYQSATYDRLTPLFTRSQLLSSSGMGAARWFGPIFHLGPVPINGVTPMFEIPLHWYNQTDQRVRVLGSIPGMRYLSMIDRAEGEVVSFASDDYQVFPVKKALPWNPENVPWAAKTVTSGPYGVSFKINS